MRVYFDCRMSQHVSTSIKYCILQVYCSLAELMQLMKCTRGELILSSWWLVLHSSEDQVAAFSPGISEMDTPLCDILHVIFEALLC